MIVSALAKRRKNQMLLHGGSLVLLFGGSSDNHRQMARNAAISVPFQDISDGMPMNSQAHKRPLRKRKNGAIDPKWTEIFLEIIA